MSLSIIASGEGDGSLDMESGVTIPEPLPPRALGEAGADLELGFPLLKEDIGLCLLLLNAWSMSFPSDAASIFQKDPFPGSS
jgi:hypothetical protein